MVKENCKENQKEDVQKRWKRNKEEDGNKAEDLNEDQDRNEDEDENGDEAEWEDYHKEEVGEEDWGQERGQEKE